MSGTQPVALFALKVPPGDILVPAVPDAAAMFRVSMAAIDPTAEPEYDDLEDKKPPRATLKLIRVPGYLFGDDDDSEDEEEDDDDDEEDLLDGLNGIGDDEDTSEEEEEEEEEEENGGPSDPEKAKKAKTSDIAKAIVEADAAEDGEDEGDDDDEEMSEDDAKAAAMLKKIMKGKGKASDNDDENDEDLDEDDDLEMEEIIVCTLDPEKNYQQTLDFVVGEDEHIFFKVTGTHTVHLTGNYVIPADDGQARLYDDEDDEDDEYDLSPDEDELEALEEEDVSDDELDDLADPRVKEVDTDEGEPPKLVAPATGKGKNKRPAPASDDEEGDEEANLDDIMAKSLKAEEPKAAAKEEPKKLTKAEKKKLKKLKKNDGEAAPASTTSTNSKTAELKKEATTTNGEKKVQFAKNLEQGPTPSATSPTKSDNKSEPKGSGGKATLGVKEVQGVIIDDRELGTGPAAKKGNKVEMRYIGKLENGKVFDGKQSLKRALSSNNPMINLSGDGAGADKSSRKKANKKGKPFGFKLGAGEVIKGWDIGVAGMSVGGERRITIPAHHGYGSKGAPPDIPPNAKLIFDLKLLTVS